MFGPVLRQRIHAAAESIVNPSRSDVFRFDPVPGEADPFDRFVFRFTCLSEDGRRLGYQHAITAHGLLLSHVDALDLIERRGLAALASHGGRTAGTRLDVLLATARGKSIPL
jgi:hypothetical protein